PHHPVAGLVVLAAEHSRILRVNRAERGIVRGCGIAEHRRFQRLARADFQRQLSRIIIGPGASVDRSSSSLNEQANWWGNDAAKERRAAGEQWRSIVVDQQRGIV